jgi:hypothetical protein
MATMGELRERARLRLDELVPAIWSDDELDECLTMALETYDCLFPREAIVDIPIADGTRTLPMPAGAQALRRLVLENGAVVPLRGAPNDGVAGEALAWEPFAGSIHLSQPLGAQTATLWVTTASDAAALPTGDEGLVVLGAVAQALEMRAIQDMKRGGQLTLAGMEQVIAQARERFEQALGRRARRVRATLVAAR